MLTTSSSKQQSTLFLELRDIRQQTYKVLGVLILTTAIQLETWFLKQEQTLKHLQVEWF